jgi:hypothetical protein
MKITVWTNNEEAPMKKSVWSVSAAIVLSLGCVDLVQAAEPAPADPAALEAALFALPGDLAPAALSSQPPVSPVPTTVYCQQPLTFVRYCKEIQGAPSSGRCGANTWHWHQCQQYKDPSGLWYYQNCGPENQTCTAPGGAECITSCPS